MLTLSSISIINAPSFPAAASAFTILNAASEPTALNVIGSSFTFQLQYNASIVGLQTAVLQIKSNDPVNPTLAIYLHGIGTAGLYGSDEPSLVQVLQANGIPTIVAQVRMTQTSIPCFTRRFPILPARKSSCRN